MTTNDIPVTEALINIPILNSRAAQAVRLGHIADAKDRAKELKSYADMLCKRLDELSEAVREPMGS